MTWREIFTACFYVLHCFRHRCLQNYIPPQSLTLSCPVCRQTSILPEKGVAALQNNFFITNLMEVLQREQDCTRPEASSGLDSAGAATYAPPLSCPNHEGKVRSSAVASYCEINVHTSLLIGKIYTFVQVDGTSIGTFVAFKL